MLALIDSHAHLDMEEFDKDRYDVVRRALQGGIRAILIPADITTAQSIQKTLDLTDKFEHLIAAAGAHPHQAKHFHADSHKKIEILGRENKIKAVGEIGFDFHYNFSSPRQQEEAFRQQLHVAQKLTLPVVVHSRNSGKNVVQAIEDEHFTKGGVLHCYTEDWKLAKRMMNHNFYISFSGILTFPGAFSLREVAKKIPLDKLLIETDSPYLVPVPFRGKKKRNEPSYIIETAKVLAELKKISLNKLAEATSQNFESLFMFEIKN